MADRNSNRPRGGTTKFPGFIIVIAIVVLGAIAYWIVEQPNIAAHPNGSTVQQSKQVQFKHLAVTSKNGAFDIEGQAVNQGKQPITQLIVQAQFHGLNGATLESRTSAVTNANGASLQTNPLPPGQMRPVQIEFTHAPEGWDGKPPVIEIKNLQRESSGAQPANGGTPSATPAGNEQNGGGSANRPNGGR